MQSCTSGELYPQNPIYGKGLICSERDLLQMMTCGFLMTADGSDYRSRSIQEKFNIIEPLGRDSGMGSQSEALDLNSSVYLEIEKDWDPGADLLCCGDVNKVHFTSQEKYAEFSGTFLAGEAPVLNLFPVDFNLDWSQILPSKISENTSDDQRAPNDMNREASQAMVILGGGVFAIFNAAIKQQVSPELLQTVYTFLRPQGLSAPKETFISLLREISLKYDEDLCIETADLQYLEACVGEIVCKFSGQDIGGRQLQSELLERIQSRSEAFQASFLSRIDSQSEEGIGRLRDSYGECMLFSALGVLTGDQDVRRLTELFEFDEGSRPGRMVHTLALFLAGCLRGSMRVPKRNIDRALMLSLSKGLVETKNPPPKRKRRKRTASAGFGIDFREISHGRKFEVFLGEHVYSTLSSCLSDSLHGIVEKLEDREISYGVINPNRVRIDGKHISEVMGFSQEECFGDVSLISTKEGLFASAVYQPKEKINWTGLSKSTFTEFLARQGLKNGVVFKPLIAEAARPPLKVQVSVFVENPSGGIQASISKLGVEIAKLYHVSWKK